MADYSEVLATQRLLSTIRLARQTEEVAAAEDGIIRIVADLCLELGKPMSIPLICRICDKPLGAADHTPCLPRAFATVEYIS